MSGQHHTWRLPPLEAFAGRVVRTRGIAAGGSEPQVLIDSIHGLSFKPRTLYLTNEAPNLQGPQAQGIRWGGPLDGGGTETNNTRALGLPTPSAPAFIGNQTAVVPGIAQIEFQGLHPGGVYFRRFNLPTFRSVRIDVATFKDIRVTVYDQTGRLYAVVATATDLEQNANPNEVVYLGTRDEPVVTPRIYSVPPGAVALLSRQADPGFAWTDLAYPQLETLYPLAGGLVAGVRVPVSASAYRISVDLLELVWEIRL